MKLIDEIQVCEHCEADMDYVGSGEWNCECGHVWYAEWLDGPGVCEWLAEQTDSKFKALYPSLARRSTNWANGDFANLYTLDRWLVKLGLHVCELPDSLWRERPAPDRGKRVAREVKIAAVKRVDAGEPMAHVARDIGVTPRSVAKWRERFAVAA